MLEQIKALLSDYTDSVKDLTEETSLAGDLGMTSMDYFIFINAIEDEYGIQITDEEVHDFFTVGDVIRCIEGKIQ